MRGKEKTKMDELTIKDWEGPKTYGGNIAGLDLIGGGAIKGLAKGAMKIAGAFANTAKQYARGGKVAKKTSNFRPLVTGNKVYDRKMINDAFAKRFGSAKPEAMPANPGNVIKDATSGKDALMNYKKVKAMAPKTEKVVKRDFFGRRLGVEPVKKVKK